MKYLLPSALMDPARSVSERNYRFHRNDTPLLRRSKRETVSHLTYSLKILHVVA
jgi:hypothetical protein